MNILFDFKKLFFMNDFDFVVIRVFDKVIVRCSFWQIIWFSYFIVFCIVFLMKSFKIGCIEGDMGKFIFNYIRIMIVVIS